jgi:hypothetical protein
MLLSQAGSLNDCTGMGPAPSWNARRSASWHQSMKARIARTPGALVLLIEAAPKDSAPQTVRAVHPAK